MEKSKCEKVRNHIPDDLAFSILSKLPLKSLKRFGCVRKSWTLLFENPHFMSNFISNHHSYYDDTSLLLHCENVRVGSHVQYLINNLSLYSISGERDRVKLEWPNPFQEYHPSFYIFDSGCITGIICLYQQQRRVILWNPAIKEFKVIPPSPVEYVPPYLSPFVILHGFGYDHVRDDYKVIRQVIFFDRNNYDYNPLWEIYSLRSNSWKKLDMDIPTGRHSDSFAGELLYMDGICHWWGVRETYNGEADLMSFDLSLVSFDLSNEVFFTTPFPFHLDIDIPSDMDDSFNLDLVMRHLMVLNGSIALISNYDDSTTFHISILGQLGVKESWTKLFIVGPLSCVDHLIGPGKKGNIFFRKKDGELVCFDLSTQMIEELGIKGDFCCQIVIYKESLFPIGGIIN